eukprot:COSAG05_NODE_14199_length_404_cov_1.186885_1_plen_46_part_01
MVYVTHIVQLTPIVATMGAAFFSTRPIYLVLAAVPRGGGADSAIFQ